MLIVDGRGERRKQDEGKNAERIENSQYYFFF